MRVRAARKNYRTAMVIGNAQRIACYITQMAAEEKQTGRLEAFSDGVFAIAITLLALELKVPHPAERHLRRARVGAGELKWPSYFAFITSFFTVLIMRLHHHVIFRFVCRTGCDALLLANGLPLSVLVTVVPFHGGGCRIFRKARPRLPRPLRSRRRRIRGHQHRVLPASNGRIS